MMTKYHKPVLLEEALEGLDIRPEGIYVDVTFGGGSHSRAILDILNSNGRLFGFDQDSDAFQNKIDDDRFEFINANFCHLTQYLKYHRVNCVDGILADLGVSSHQFDVGSRGFSIRKSGRLDMRMNQSQHLDAHYVVNHYDENALYQMFINYGELRNAKKITQQILHYREEAEIKTTLDLIQIVKPVVSKRFENKVLAKIFQSIRIEVNDELVVLKTFLQQAAVLLKPGGRLACISYHSLEDRCIKRFIKNGNFGELQEKDFYGNSLSQLHKVGKLIIPSKKELEENSRARSAKLRIAEKK